MLSEYDLEEFENIKSYLNNTITQYPSFINSNILTNEASFEWYNKMPKCLLDVKSEIIKKEINKIRQVNSVILKEDISNKKTFFNAYKNINQSVISDIEDTLKILDANLWEYNFEYKISVDKDIINNFKDSIFNKWDTTYKKIIKKNNKEKNINITSDTPYKNEDLLLEFFLEVGQEIDNFLKENIYKELENNRKFKRLLKKEMVKCDNVVQIYKTPELKTNLYPSALRIGISQINLNDVINFIEVKHNDKWTRIIVDSNYDKQFAVNAYLKNVIKTDFRKHPVLGKKLSNFLNLNNLFSYTGFDLVDKVKNNLDILKSENVNILEHLQKEGATLERIDDLIEATLLKNKTNKLMNSIISNKYRYLVEDNEAAYKTFKEFVGLNLSKEDIQKEIGNKLARYKTPAEFNNGIQNILNVYNGFNMSNIEKKSSNLNVKIISKEITDNELLLEINDYKASKELGSQAWCISYNEHFFKEYKDEDNKQYFFYDFNKSSEDEYSMIGFTMNTKNRIIHAHDKHDDSIINNKKLMELLLKKVMKNNKKTMKLK